MQPLRACCHVLVPLLQAVAGVREYWIELIGPGLEDWDYRWAGVAAAVRELGFGVWMSQ